MYSYSIYSFWFCLSSELWKVFKDKLSLVVNYLWHSRLATFLLDFAPAFSAADRVIVTKVRFDTDYCCW